jgi:hypothetical protein
MLLVVQIYICTDDIQREREESKEEGNLAKISKKFEDHHVFESMFFIVFLLRIKYTCSAFFSVLY